MIRIYGRRGSSNASKVFWALAELDIPYEQIDAGGSFGTIAPELNPNGTIPVLEEGSFRLWESNAIVRYLASQHGRGALWPLAPRVRASADRWMDWAATSVAPVIGGLRSVYKAKPPDPAALEVAVEACAKLWRILASELESHAFAASDDLTVADIALGPFIHRWQIAPVARPEIPAVSA
jgi:glutathione S-transferase